MQCVAVDIGTSFTKAAILHPKSGTIRQIQRVPAVARLPCSDPLLVEFDADRIVTQVRQLIGDLLPRADSCAGILLSGQMGGLVLTDTRGDARQPYISWQDKRLTGRVDCGDQSWFDRLSQIVGARATHVLGNEFRPGLPLPLLYWLNETGRLPGGLAIPCTLPDYVAARLCDAVPVMEWTSTCGLLDVCKREFAFDLLHELNLSSLQWPPIVDFRHCVGHLQTTAGGPGIPVYAAVGDHQCSLVGTFLNADELSVNVSTGSQMSLLTDTAAAGSFQLRPFFDGRWLKTITNIPAGRALSGLVKLLSEIPADGRSAGDAAAWSCFFAKAEAVAHTDVQADLAFFPSVIPGPGGLRNLHEDNLTVGHVARAALQSMADYYHQLSSQLDAERGWHSGVLSGGVAVQSRLLRQLIADRLKTTFRLASHTEENLMGLLVLGRVVTGLEASVADAQAALRSSF